MALSQGSFQRYLRRFTAATSVATLGLAVTLAVILTGMGGKPAHAEDPPTLAEAQRQVNDLTEKMTVANEQLNQVRDQLDASRKRQNELNDQLKSEQANVDTLEIEVGQIGSVAYESGPLVSVSAMLSSKSPSALVEQLTYLDVLTAQQQESISELSESRDGLKTTKNEVDAEVSNFANKENELNTNKENLQKDLDKWNELRKQLSPPVSRNENRPTYNGQASGDAEIAVKYAYDQIGKPYSFGAAGPNSFDCSGLTKAAWAQAGVSIPHSSSEQYNQLNKVDRANIVAGDLIIYYGDMHHVGIYIGSSQVIHAPQPGENVKVSSINAMPYYGAVRP